MQQLGPDKEFVFGRPVSAGDRGGCNAAFIILKDLRIVALNFGTVLTWLYDTPEVALELAAMLRARITEVFGTLPCDASTLPLKVIANKANRIVETTMPEPVGVLAANPEMFLAWADKLEQAAREIIGVPN